MYKCKCSTTLVFIEWRMDLYDFDLFRWWIPLTRNFHHNLIYILSHFQIIKNIQKKKRWFILMCVWFVCVVSFWLRFVYTPTLSEFKSGKSATNLCNAILLIHTNRPLYEVKSHFALIHCLNSECKKLNLISMEFFKIQRVYFLSQCVFMFAQSFIFFLNIHRNRKVFQLDKIKIKIENFFIKDLWSD